jgi:hypothetical protein
MRALQILNQISQGQLIKEVCLNNITLEEDSYVISILKKGDAIEKFQIEDSFLHDEFVKNIVIAIGKHISLKILSFKECSFSSEGPVFFSQNFMKNQKLEKLELILVANDDDLSKFIKGLTNHMNIKSLIIEDCINIGEKTINELSQLVSINKTIKFIDIKRSVFRTDVLPLITACKNRTENPIQWKVEESESIFDDKQIEELIQVTSFSAKTQGSKFMMFGASQQKLDATISEKKESSVQDFEKKVENLFEGDHSLVEVFKTVFKKATQCGHNVDEVNEAWESARERTESSLKDSHS